MSTMPTVKPAPTWVYPAQLDRVVDGDTAVFVLDCGMQIYHHTIIRFARCNAPEAKTPNGIVATSYTTQWLQLVTDPALLRKGTRRAVVQGKPDPLWPFMIQTHKTDTYGRYVGEVWRLTDQHNISDDLLAAGHATPYPPVKEGM